MKKQTLQYLLEKMRLGTLLPEERKQLDIWEASLDKEEGLLELYTTEEQMLMKQRVWAYIDGRTQPSRNLVHFGSKMKGVRWYRIAAAAAFLAFLGTGVYMAYQPSSARQLAETKKAEERIKNDVMPGTSGAILTLANGQQVILDTASAGPLALQGAAQILNRHGELRYTSATAASEDKPLTNTLSTPNGRQYQLMLADGTRVWLNAASSITYPTTFTGGERSVKMTGEVYFEVAKDRNRPFKVKINEATEIKVLGTHFNVNAYYDEAGVAATLLEGSVIMQSVNNRHILQPGQQIIAKSGGTLELNTKADAQQSVAWKNGIFNFHRMQLKEVMRQLSRWYDISVSYEKSIPDITIGGKMGRDLNLSQVLEILSEMGVHYRLEQGRKLVILP